VAAGLLSVTGSIAVLLAWVTLKPLVRPSPAWAAPASVTLNWGEAMRPRPLGKIGVALEHGQADAEIIGRALGLAQADNERPELILLHVVDTPITLVHGNDTADRETGADARYLAELVATLRERGFRARSVLLYGPDPAGQLVGYLRTDAVDLLVVGSHGHGLVRDLLFGQTVDRVRHGLEIPMLIARPGRLPTSHRLGEPEDAATASEEMF
jgi:manganese transport protein